MIAVWEPEVRKDGYVALAKDETQQELQAALAVADAKE